MSWIEKLYKTYENNMALIGEGDNPLLPVGHTTQKRAHIQITLDGKGIFLRASVVPEADARTTIPATDESAGRTSGEAPHPLSDKLQYIAEDYCRYGGTKAPYFDSYRDQLERWCASPFCHPKVKAVLQYIKCGRVIEDLTRAGVLHSEKDGKLAKKWEGSKGDIPPIFDATKNAGGQTEAFVRWCVELPGDLQPELWSDGSVWQSWIDYYGSTKKAHGLCYVTGGDMPLPDQHPRKIRGDGDGAKLISSNDTSGFTFRGRFTNADEVCGVGFDVTQKAHSALRWLIARQGFIEFIKDGSRTKPSLAVVAWAVSGAEIPSPLWDTALLSEATKSDKNVNSTDSYTAQEIGTQLSKMIRGYSAKLGPTDDVIVMGLDSATPGRMSIVFYRELTGSDFLERIESWHRECCWLQRFSKEKVFIGAPSPRDIAESAYGKTLKSNTTLRKATVERLLPCIIDGTPIPRDLVISCVRRASNRNGIEWWEWEKALGIACALYQHQNSERRYLMSLERDRKTRDYLYGRLLALAEHLESRALYVAGEKRETNASKMMQRFAERPYSTWLNIETSLTPYKVRLRAKRPGFLRNIETEIDEVMNSFVTSDYLSDWSLTGEFLLGYHCQRAELRPKTDEDTIDSVDIED